MYEKVVNLITNQLPVKADKIKRESRLLEDLGADSANIMILIMDLESEFDIVVEDDALTTIRTVGDVVDYLEKHAANR
ncbi:acyl carrier protein [Bacillota bacterium Meth-B3]|nr:acyl carrier protein [Christensenellaceae bacterium]MEA5064792.1 acyl carrier protein [Eubacteriales bacterium]MEA5067604.1 acyl carrier protein [Christensenellaceae bacterium]